MYLDWNDEDFKDSLKNLISCALPHENYDASFYSEIVNKLTNLIHVDEMEITFRILCDCLSSLAKIHVSVEGYVPVLERDNFDDIISHSFDEFISNHTNQVQKFMSERGVDFDYAIPEKVQDAKAMLYNEVMALYDDCFSRGVSSNQYPPVYLALKSAFKTNATAYSLQSAFKVMNEGLYYNRKMLKGSDGYTEYMTSFLSEFKARMDDTEETFGVIDSIDKVHKIREMNKVQTSRICDYGIPNVDDYTPMLRSRLQVVVAPVNTGKTSIMCYIAAKLIKEGKKVAIWTGESPFNVIYNSIISSYIKLKYGYFITASQVSGSQECEPEAQEIINKACIDVYKSQCLAPIDSLHYESVVDDLKAAYDKFKFDVVIVDHSYTLLSEKNSRLTMQDKISSLAVGLRNFKRMYPVDVIVSSHPSTDAEMDIKKFGYIKPSTGSTKGSNDLDKEADEVFVLISNETLIKSNLVEFYTKKRRGATPHYGKTLLKFYRQFSYFEYSDELQDDVDKVDKDEALREIQDEIELDLDGDEFDISTLG